MAFLPIVDRELRVAARQRTTYRKRSGFALAAIIIGGLVYLATYGLSARQFADNLLGVLISLSVFYCLTSGIRSTADCLSEEKREGTLGLLFLTDLRGYDVVFGKMAATSLRGFYALFAIFPILALPLMIGGVTYGEFWRLVLTLVDMFLFSQAIGILVSALSRHARKALAATFIMLFCFSAVLPAAMAIIQWLVPARMQLAYFVLLPSPCSSLYWFHDRHYRTGPQFFWLSVGVSYAWTALFLVLASLIAPHSWQDRPGSAMVRRWRELRHDWNYGNAAQRKVFRQRLLGVNAFYWLAARVRAKPMQVWLALALVAGLWGWGCVEFGSEWFNEGVYFPTAIILNTMLKLWIASEAGRQLGNDRKLGALELVLSTSLRVKDILRGQWLALGRQFLAPLVMVIGVELVFLTATLQRESFQSDPMNPTLWLAGLVLLVADVAALCWVGIWVALTANNPNRITSLTVLRVVVAPCIVYAAVLAVVSGINAAGHYSLPPPGWKILVGLWFGLGVLTDAAFGLIAWRRVLTKFRELGVFSGDHAKRAHAKNS